MEVEEVLILAGGVHAWWPHDLYKHLLPIQDEPLISRTVRQVREREREPIVVTGDPRIIALEPSHFVPVDGPWEISGIHSTAEIWRGERTVILWGDVVWPGRAIDLVLEQPIDNLVFWWGHPAGVQAMSIPQKWYDKLARILADLHTEPKLEGWRRFAEHAARVLCDSGLLNPTPFGCQYIKTLLGDSYMQDLDTLPIYLDWIDDNQWARGRTLEEWLGKHSWARNDRCRAWLRKNPLGPTRTEFFVWAGRQRIPIDATCRAYSGWLASLLWDRIGKGEL